MNKEEFNLIHTYPVDDMVKHDLTSIDGDCKCWCLPTKEIYQNGVQFVHNSFDGREFFESTVVIQ